MRFFRVLAIVFPVFFLNAQQASALEAREIFKLAEPGVVVVLASDAKGEKNSQGNGVLIAPLEIVTSCKVVESAADIVVTQGSALRKAALHYKDSERDLCQLHIEDALPAGKPAARAPSSASLESGQDLFAISSPRGLERTISRTMVSGLRETPGASGRLIQIDLQLSGSSAGAGVFDQEARLVGIITPQFRQGESATYAVPVEWIAELAQRSPDRLLATNVSSTPVAGTSAGNVPPPADAPPAWMPRVGDRWKYRLIDGKRAVGTILIEVIDARGKTAEERITFEDKKGFFAERNVDAEFKPIRFQEIVPLPGGFQLAEISPYASSDQGPKAGQQWSDIPVSLLLVWYGKRKFLLQAKIIRQETVRVPAGEFNTMLMEAVARENLGSSIVKITTRHWYAPQIMRTVKMSLHIEFSVGAFASSVETYELVAFEPAK